jgi:DNA helicase-2/ATP-dependent DNA helicase PcrA
MSETDATLERVAPVESRRERRLSLRRRATELLDLLEGTRPDEPESTAAREGFATELVELALAAATGADEARAAGLDPLTLRVLATDGGVGANVLAIAALPSGFSYTQLDTYERCPLQYAFRYVYRIPTSRVVAALTFGTAAHEAFEAFTRERRERIARGEPPPTRDELEGLFDERLAAGEFPDRLTEATYRGRVATLVDHFWEDEINRPAEVIGEEIEFSLVLDPGDGSPRVRVGGEIDRIDRLPSGGLEVIDYKTGRPSSQKDVLENLQLSIYALACRDALGLGTPETVTLYFTEAGSRMSTTRSDEQLQEARSDILERAARIRSGDFAATPSSDACWRCDYAPMCPSRVR